jgi:hypothetical protein
MNELPRKTIMSRNILSVFASALALGAFVTAGPADALPLAFMNTGNCTTDSTADTQSCQQHSTGVADIFAQARLDDLSATARIDNFGPFSFAARASVFYFMELLSSTGVFGDLIPLRISATGVTEVGGAVTTGTFNHNKATADVRFGSSSVASACSGFGCFPGSQASFDGVFLIEIRPLTFGPNEFRIEVGVTAETNSNLPTSFASAFADPFIEIDPAYLALHPEYSLAFSANVTNGPAIGPGPEPGSVPLPATIWLFGLGLLVLAGVTRRQSLR